MTTVTKALTEEQRRALLDLGRQRHDAIDSVMAAYMIRHREKRPGNTTVLELLQWSHERLEAFERGEDE